jgi:hypothetical protein
MVVRIPGKVVRIPESGSVEIERREVNAVVDVLRPHKHSLVCRRWFVLEQMVDGVGC